MSKASRYNIYGENTNGKKYIFNSYTRQCELLDDKVFQAIKDNKQDEQNWSGKSRSELLKKGFIVEDHVDEIELVDHKFNMAAYASDMLDLTFVMTHACNLRCIYCYQQGATKSFTDETQKRVIKYIEHSVKNGTRKLFVNWFGGEPLVEAERVLKMSEEIYEIVKKYHVSYIGRMTSNGYLLEKDLFEKLISYRTINFMITIDGTKEHHDAQRPHKSGGGSYDKIINNLLAIKSINKRFVIDVRVNVSTENGKDIEEFVDEFKRLFGDDKRFNLVFEAVHDWKGERIGEHMESVVADADVIKEIYEISIKKDIPLRNYLEYSTEVQICPAVKKTGFIIDGEANVFKCEMAMSDEVFGKESLVGYIDQSGKMVLDTVKEAKWLTRSRNLSMCYDCVAYPYCMGGGQCNYGMKFHHELRCKDNVDYLIWSSEMLSMKREEELWIE